MSEEHLCQFCISEFVRRLIDIEQCQIDLRDFTSEDLLFLIGENMSLENIRHMEAAKEELLGNPTNKGIKTVLEQT